MPTINVSSWESFEQKLRKLRQDQVSAGSKTDFLFRGLIDSTLPLTTTLERAGHEGIRVSEYYQIIEQVSPDGRPNGPNHGRKR